MLHGTAFQIIKFIKKYSYLFLLTLTNEQLLNTAVSFSWVCAIHTDSLKYKMCKLTSLIFSNSSSLQ